MNYNLVNDIQKSPIGQFSVRKPIPCLVDKGLIKYIAKINNIDVNTGNVIQGPPSEFQLLCRDIKNLIIRFIRHNLLLIVLLIIIIVLLYYRYLNVKKRKKLLKKINNNQ